MRFSIQPHLPRAPHLLLQFFTFAAQFCKRRIEMENYQKIEKVGEGEIDFKWPSIGARSGVDIFKGRTVSFTKLAT